MAQTRTSPEGITQQLAKALAHPLRVRILTSLHKGVSSPNQLAQELGEPLGNVSYHVKTLLEYDCVELVKTEPRRGAVEHFYRATERAFFSAGDWEKIPASARKGISGVDPRDDRPGRDRGAGRRHASTPAPTPTSAAPRWSSTSRAGPRSPRCSPTRSTGRSRSRRKRPPASPTSKSDPIATKLAILHFESPAKDDAKK